MCGGGTGTTPPACGAEAAAGGRWRVPVGAVKRGGAPRAPERAGRAAGVPGGGGEGVSPVAVGAFPSGGDRRWPRRGRARGLPGRVLRGAGTLTGAWGFIY